MVPRNRAGKLQPSVSSTIPLFYSVVGKNLDCDHKADDQGPMQPAEHLLEFAPVEPVNSDMAAEASPLQAPPQKPSVPALLQRSPKRASRMSDDVVLALDTVNVNMKKGSDGISRMQQNDPHELYLSSEEEASLSDDYDDDDDDDDSDSLLDFDSTYSDDESTGCPSRTSSRKSREVTATAVNFKVVGKPQIVKINIRSNHVSPTDMPAEEKLHEMHFSADLPIIRAPSPEPSKRRPAARRPAPLNLHSARPMSTATLDGLSSTAYTPALHTNASLVNLSTQSGQVPPRAQRKPSRLASFVNLSKKNLSVSSALSTPSARSATSQHSFLDSDPYAHSASHKPPLTPTDFPTASTPKTPKTPKTPTSMSSSSSAWKRSLSRTLSKARKPSTQMLSATYHSSSPRTSTMAPPELTRINSNPEPPTPKLFEEKHHLRAPAHTGGQLDAAGPRGPEVV
ncbi:uncharacterized protein L3040_002781 [Drepanopeziza brunnea f. sp. 'multigermtubi']|uniref:uncharacterized protein n=1 Tax=Drepanopeziza brunnea f. sp. 'multigermtubi' TaxID=698441 RepID=UPI00239DDA17|nr:hypothetical protein L3040_002781 [Drepanopeziza brunnea f. sp. 'multigermtubi']